MVNTIEALDAVQGRAFKLYNKENNSDYESQVSLDEVSSLDEVHKIKSAAELVETNSQVWTTKAKPREDESEDDNLIELKLRE